MIDSLSDFESKLYSIKPFIQTESPPSSDQKPSKNDALIIDKADHPFHLSDHPTFQQDLQSNTSLRRALSEQSTPQEHVEQYSHKTITSISSTIDMLFSKIQKIKQQFSYALDKPHSEQDIQFKQVPPLTHFHSQRLVDYQCNKQNHQEKEIAVVRKKTGESSSKKPLLHAHSLPLQEHTDNYNYKQFISFPHSIFEEKQQQNLFTPFQQEAQEPKRLQIRDFQLGKCIGSGKFGDVYLSIHKESGFICAIKKIFKSTIKQYNMQQQFTNQLRIHYKLTHPNIVRLYNHFQDEYHIFLMMEYACDGTLMQRLKAQQSFVSQSVDQALQAISYMHRNKIVHRDIKPENIVLCFNTIKICDFGWSTVLENQMKRTFCGTLDYVSPQMKDVGQYNESVDLWSIGVLTFELIAGFPPYKHQISYWKLCGSQRKMKWSWQVIYPPQIGHFAQKFIEGLLKQNPLQRATISQCRSSYFIQKYRPIQSPSVEQEFSILLL